MAEEGPGQGGLAGREGALIGAEASNRHLAAAGGGKGGNDVMVKGLLSATAPLPIVWPNSEWSEVLLAARGETNLPSLIRDRVASWTSMVCRRKLQSANPQLGLSPSSGGECPQPIVKKKY